jgi:hypothetical protein
LTVSLAKSRFFAVILIKTHFRIQQNHVGVVILLNSSTIKICVLGNLQPSCVARRLELQDRYVILNNTFIDQEKGMENLVETWSSKVYKVFIFLFFLNFLFIIRFNHVWIYIVYHNLEVSLVRSVVRFLKICTWGAKMQLNTIFIYLPQFLS